MFIYISRIPPSLLPKQPVVLQWRGRGSLILFSHRQLNSKCICSIHSDHIYGQQQKSIKLPYMHGRKLSIQRSLLKDLTLEWSELDSHNAQNWLSLDEQRGFWMCEHCPIRTTFVAHTVSRENGTTLGHLFPQFTGSWITVFLKCHTWKA